MNLVAHYDAMREAAMRRLVQGEVEVDNLIDSPHDHRRGITLLTRPPAAIAARIEEILADFQRLEPDQYYYPASDIHVTILSIISCYEGFRLDLTNPAAYQNAVRSILQSGFSFTMRYEGLTASPGSVIVQGFPVGDGLDVLRAATRAYFQSAGLQQSIDQRYSLQTAHSTVMRFRKPLRNATQLLEKLLQYQHHFIGSFEVNSVELVYNDWYQRARHTEVVARFPLDKSPANNPSAFL